MPTRSPESREAPIDRHGARRGDEPRHVNGSNSVTVTVEWKDTEIAIGETTIFSGDKVTLKTR